MARPIRRLLDPRWLCSCLMLACLGLLFQQWASDPARQFKIGLNAFSENDRSGMEQAIDRLSSDSRYKLHRDFLRASLLLQDGKPQEAYELAISSQDHPDVAVQSKVLAGEAMYQLGAAGNAKLFWEQALALDPDCLLAHKWLGAMYFDLGAMDNAILHLQMVSRLSPDDPRPDRFMGLINRDYERPEIAIPHYLETLRRDPQQPDVAQVWLELADCQIKQREYAEATASLQNCQESSERNRLLARCELNLGEIDSARERAQAALETDQNNLESLQLAADIALVDGDAESAADYLRLAIEADPYDHGVRAQLAQVFARLGNQEESEKQSRRAEELQKIWQEFSDLQIDAINQVTNAELRFKIGTLAEQLGKSELAIGWYKAAMAINPGHRESERSLTRLESQSD